MTGSADLQHFHVFRELILKNFVPDDGEHPIFEARPAMETPARASASATWKLFAKYLVNIVKKLRPNSQCSWTLAPANSMQSVWRPQQEVTRPKARFKHYLAQDVSGYGEAIRCQNSVFCCINHFCSSEKMKIYILVTVSGTYRVGLAGTLINLQHVTWTLEEKSWNDLRN